MRRLHNASELLDHVIRATRAGLAENEPTDAGSFFARFLPVPRHLRALDPLVRIIIGDKGAGKTQLFQALKFPEGRALLASMAKKQGLVALPLDRISWQVGFETQGTRFPSPAAFERMKESRVEEFRSVWLALLVRVLHEQLAPFLDDLPGGYRTLITQAVAPHDLGVLSQDTRLYEGQLVAAIDRLEEKLAADDRHAVVVYDELDRVSPGDWDVITAVLRGLVQWWAVYLRRWQRIRCKIFLRRDLFERAALRGPDVAKIAWNPAELEWTVGDLYRLMFKRLANTSPRMRSYLQQARLDLVKKDLLAWTPTADDWLEFAGPINYMMGEYMGDEPKKGLTIRWIPNHLKDGHGRVFPRPLLRLLEKAAELEQYQQMASASRLLHHTSLRGALDEVSRFRVDELINDEFPWLRRIQSAFAQSPFRVPAERKNVRAALAAIDWSSENEKPPETNPDALLDYLVDLGLLSARIGGKLDVGDLYLAGFHLKRRGGVARPRG